MSAHMETDTGDFGDLAPSLSFTVASRELLREGLDNAIGVATRVIAISGQ